MKEFFKIFPQKFGNDKKLVQSLHPQNKKMLRRQLHIETVNWFSPKGDDTICGACTESA